jgi:simple sugar transport system permease protein
MADPGAVSARWRLELRQSPGPGVRAGAVTAALAAGLAIAVMLLDLAGIAPGDLFEQVVIETLFNADALRAVLVQAAPLALVGIGAGLAFRVGFWNLGLEGQMIWGGIAATAVSLFEIGPAPLRLGLMALAAAAAAALWLGLTAWLKQRFRVNEIIATLLLNYVATYFLFHLLYGAWQDPGTAFPQSPQFRPFERLPEIAPSIGAGLAIAIGVAVAAAWLVHVSRLGFHMGFISADPRVAHAVGVPVRAVVLITVLVSGAAAGLAGFVNIAGQEGRLTQSFADGYVFSGVLIGFLSRNDPIIAALVAFLVATLFVAGQSLEVFYQIPFSMVQVIEAIIVMLVAASEFLVRHRLRRLRPGEAP